MAYFEKQQFTPFHDKAINTHALAPNHCRRYCFCTIPSILSQAKTKSTALIDRLLARGGVSIWPGILIQPFYRLSIEVHNIVSVKISMTYEVLNSGPETTLGA